MSDDELLVFRTRALNRTAEKLQRIRQIAADSKHQRGLVDADDILLITDRFPRPTH